MPFNTRNPIPSGDLRDLDDNARNIDTWANDKTKLSHPDRFGVERYTWHGIEQKAQLDLADAAHDAAAEATEQANAARDQAIAAKLAAMNAAASSGITKYADTKGIMTDGVGTTYVNGDVVLVFADESQSGASAIYKIDANSAVFKTLFDQARADLLSFTGNISADAEWSDVPAHSDPAFDAQAQALANRTERLKQRTVLLSDFASTGSAVAYAIANSKKILVDKNATVNIPSDASSINEALNVLSPFDHSVTITLRINSGYVLPSGVNIADRDCSQFKITSEDAEVNLATGFSGNIFEATGKGFLPVIACLFNAQNQVAGDGIYVHDGARVVVLPSCGVKGAYGTGLQASYGSQAVANYSNFSYCARNGNTGAGITAWASVVSAEYADVSFSGYYGAQAAHGGMGSFKNIKAHDCGRLGIRATDGALIDAEGCDASRAANVGIYAFNGGMISANPATAKNCGIQNVVATNGSIINVMNGDLTGGGAYGIYAANASLVNADKANVSGAGKNGIFSGAGSTVVALSVNARKGASDSSSDIWVQGGGVVNANSSTIGGTSIEPNTLTLHGMITGDIPYTYKSELVNVNRHNWDLSVDTTSYVQVYSDGGNRNVSGILKGHNGSEIRIKNTSASASFVFLHESDLSDAANRISTPGNVSFTITPGQVAHLKYANGRWHIL